MKNKDKTSLWLLVASEKKNLSIAFIATLLTALFSLAGPYLIGYAVDHYLIQGIYKGILMFSGILLAVYFLSFLSNIVQMRMMGRVGQHVLFDVRNKIFTKLQSLPLAFFNEHKAGDLISRINNDTEKLNHFFSETLVRFVSSLFMIGGAAVFVLILSFKLGAAALIPAVVVWIITALISSIVKKKNKQSLQTVGGMSAEVDESLKNFKVIVAFNRRDYFREKFNGVNEKNYVANIQAGALNGLFSPLYDVAANAGQLIVLAYGIFLITQGLFTVGLLISFLAYIERFYNPLRQMAVLWSQVQLAFASWDRVQEILLAPSNMKYLPPSESAASSSVLEFKNVSFAYPDMPGIEGKKVLSNISLSLEQGKTYALVGPTGGGKTTTASLMARLYDPTEGEVQLFGKDIRSYTDTDRTNAIGFILQEPFIFRGTLADNIIFGNDHYNDASQEKIMEGLKRLNLDHLISRFDNGLALEITGGEGMSLGQKQIIAFIRAIMREPKLLILDEATANIDTITEGVLEEIIDKLPQETTKVIIAHRLNTIRNADEIFFVNGGTLTPAGSMEHALEMLLHEKRSS